MKWYYQIRGGHTHVRVFVNGGKCGDLCFRNEEFQHIKNSATDHMPEHLFTFIDETPVEPPHKCSYREDSTVCEICGA